MLEKSVINIKSEYSKLEGSVNRGCPQGGVLSPLPWKPTVDSLLEYLEEINVHTVGYADDLAIMVRGKFMDTIVDVMGETNLRVTIWNIWIRDYSLGVTCGENPGGKKGITSVCER